MRRTDRPALYKAVYDRPNHVAELHSTKGEYRRNLASLGMKRKRKHLIRARRLAEHAVACGHGYETLEAQEKSQGRSETLKTLKEPEAGQGGQGGEGADTR